MFNKKINLLFITLVFMLSISAVAAFDSTAVSDDIEMGDVDEEPPSGIAVVPSDIISVSNDDYTLQTKDLSMYYKNGTRYEVTLMNEEGPVENASVIINIAGINYTKFTNDEGIASLAINLIPGNYMVSTYFEDNSDLMMLSSDVEVLSTLSGDDVVKIYKNDTQYYATFLDNNGNPLANSDVTFNINGVFYNRKTNENGVARLNINLNTGEYILTAIHQNGLMCSNNITVLPSINGSDVIKFYKNATQYHASFLDSNGLALANTNVTFNINGVFYSKMTDDEGIAKLNINLLPGTYILTAINPVNGEMFSNTVHVISTISASDLFSENKSIIYEVLLFSNDGSVGKNKNIQITIGDAVYAVETDEDGVATLNTELPDGVYEATIEDLQTGLKVGKIITVDAEEDEILYYSQYGVSPDNKTIMAIGRPSASGETSKYGYKFYATVFERVCPYCGSTELYWGIFWTGDETSNYGVFPVTGHKEGGSAEGHIFCANCDCDWSVFGNEHVSGGKSLKIVSEPVLSSKTAAYALKNGEMIYE